MQLIMPFPENTPRCNMEPGHPAFLDESPFRRNCSRWISHILDRTVKLGLDSGQRTPAFPGSVSIPDSTWPKLGLLSEPPNRSEKQSLDTEAQARPSSKDFLPA